MYRIYMYKKILQSDEGDFKIWVKGGIYFLRNFTVHFRELPDDLGWETYRETGSAIRYVSRYIDAIIQQHLEAKFL